MSTWGTSRSRKGSSDVGEAYAKKFELLHIEFTVINPCSPDMATLLTLPTARLATPVPNKRLTRQRVVTCSKKDHAAGGIHDPLGV